MSAPTAIQVRDKSIRAASGSRSGPRSLPMWASWLSTLAILAFWWLGTSTGLINSRVLPGPDKVLAAGWQLAAKGVLGEAVVVSVGRVLGGVIIGLVVGLILGLLSGYFLVSEAVVDKPLQMLRAIPFNALTPLFIIAFGVGETMKVLLIGVGVLVPIYLNTFAGVRGVDRKLVEVGTVYRIPKFLIATRILFLGALPSVFTGLRFSLAIAWIALVTSETVNANAGIGFILTQAQRFVRTDQVVLCIAIYAFLGIFTDWIVRCLEGRFLRWRGVYQGN